jgi:E3 ubiquitin-protein ligase UBR4
LVELAQKYCGECKNSFEDLSKIIQRVMATRKELVAFDESRKIRLTERPFSNEHEAFQTDGVVLTKCYGCASASVEHCLTILRALASKSSLR